MKPIPYRRATFIAVLFTALSPQLSTCFAQGSLTPPGAPAPTMKSIAQVEPRTPISSAPYTVSTPGSYYLTTNLNVTVGDAMDITASGVTLDLNGFTVSSTDPGNTGTGIMLAGGNADITILNGHVRGGVIYSGGGYIGSGFGNGIFWTGSNIPFNIRISGVWVSGCLLEGINMGILRSTVVESCTVQNVGGDGIVAASVSHSVVYQSGYYGIYADSASGCYSQTTGTGSGLFAYTANNCYGQSLGSTIGLQANIANNCQGQSTSGTGLSVNHTTTGCYGQSGGSGYELTANIANNCEDQSSSGTGLSANHTATGCYGQSSSGTGLSATSTASGCYGNSATSQGLAAGSATGCSGFSGPGGTGVGLYVNTANNCEGQSYGSGTGLDAFQTVTGCYGCSASGAGLVSNVANSCVGLGTPNYIVAHPYNMP
jgi:hypothetical protein